MTTTASIFALLFASVAALLFARRRGARARATRLQVAQNLLRHAPLQTRQHAAA